MCISIRHFYLQDYLDNGNSANIPILINLFPSSDKNVKAAVFQMQNNKTMIFFK